jgi:hypothetical protein
MDARRIARIRVEPIDSEPHTPDPIP